MRQFSGEVPSAIVFTVLWLADACPAVMDQISKPMMIGCFLMGMLIKSLKFRGGLGVERQLCVQA